MPDLLTIAQIGSITTAALGLATTLVTRTAPWIRTKLTSRAVTRRLGTILTGGQIERAVRYYVEPMCQDVDPAGAEEPRLVFGVRQRLFKVLDEALIHPTEFRYIFLLADSGMGKSSALINYYARHLRRLRSDFEIELVPLGIPNADERIAAITDKASKVLFLDAFDEDTLAIVDHLERLRNLLKATQEFRRVLITCRTQFFGKDEEIPVRTGLIKVGARGPGEPAEYFFHKIYLSPFGDAEIKRYLRKRYPAWRPNLRRQASRMVARIPNLSARPMLLAHVDDIVREHREVYSSVELYEELVEAWLRREDGFIQNKAELRRFSELLAADIFLNRLRRGAERVTHQEIERLARVWDVRIESWALTGRSLLNRDAEGNFKFAHRSIMEYLFLKALARKELRSISEPWTDQMKTFFLEGLAACLPWVINMPSQMPLSDRKILLGRIIPGNDASLLTDFMLTFEHGGRGRRIPKFLIFRRIADPGMLEMGVLYEDGYFVVYGGEASIRYFIDRELDRSIPLRLRCSFSTGDANFSMIFFGEDNRYATFFLELTKDNMSIAMPWAELVDSI